MLKSDGDSGPDAMDVMDVCDAFRSDSGLGDTGGDPKVILILDSSTEDTLEGCRLLKGWILITPLILGRDTGEVTGVTERLKLLSLFTFLNAKFATLKISSV